MIHKGKNITKLELPHEVDVAYAALDAKTYAKRIGFATKDQYLISTAVSELARNIITYASKGCIFLSTIDQDLKKGIEVVADDSGPGIHDLEKAMLDNFSTRGTLGVGLPGTKRLMDDFQISSSSAEGTTVTVRKWI
jgi:serine/threonine-protein kinase RsbT